MGQRGQLHRQRQPIPDFIIGDGLTAALEHPQARPECGCLKPCMVVKAATGRFAGAPKAMRHLFHHIDRRGRERACRGMLVSMRVAICMPVIVVMVMPMPMIVIVIVVMMRVTVVVIVTRCVMGVAVVTLRMRVTMPMPLRGMKLLVDRRERDFIQQRERPHRPTRSMRNRLDPARRDAVSKQGQGLIHPGPGNRVQIQRGLRRQIRVLVLHRSPSRAEQKACDDIGLV